MPLVIELILRIPGGNSVSVTLAARVRGVNPFMTLL